MISGFRVARGGAAELYGITPDLATFGKIIGGGMPVGAFGGSRELMSHLAPLGGVYQAGTLSGNPVAMAAGLATLRVLERDDVWQRLEELGAELERRSRRFWRAAPLPVSLVRVGSIFWLSLQAGAPPRAAEAIAPRRGRPSTAPIFHALLERGIALAPSAYEVGFLSAAHRTATSFGSPRSCPPRSRAAPRRSAPETMTRPSRHTRGLQLGFLALLVFSTAQVVWWIYDQTQLARRERENLERLYETEAQLAGRLLAEGRKWDEISRLLPDLALEGGRVRAFVRRGRRRSADEQTRRLRRYGWEGTFFLLVLVAGMAVIWRTPAPGRGAAAPAAELPGRGDARVQEPARQHPARGRDDRAAPTRAGSGSPAGRAHARGHRPAREHGVEDPRHARASRPDGCA